MVEWEVELVEAWEVAWAAVLVLEVVLVEAWEVAWVAVLVVVLVEA